MSKVKSGNALSSRDGHSACLYSEQSLMYIFGGFIAGVNCNSIVAYNFSTRKWTEIECLGEKPCPRNGHSACIYKGFMYVFGGRTSENKKLNDLWKLDLKA